MVKARTAREHTDARYGCGGADGGVHTAHCSGSKASSVIIPVFSLISIVVFSAVMSHATIWIAAMGSGKFVSERRISNLARADTYRNSQPERCKS